MRFDSGRSLLPLRRFVVSDRSMEPTLVEGQGLLATPYGAAKSGQVRCFEHPRRRGFWLVKRVSQVEGASMTVSSDNPAGVDSRAFGPVPVAGSYRVMLAIPRRFM
ncbi:MAG: hypothetical protein V9G09_06200 [Candidatus Nanopelagicales bacterium]